MSIIYVNQQSAGGDGASWQNAYRTLNTALTNANDGDEIWVARGTYRPGPERDDTFGISKSVSVFGGFQGIEENRRDRNWEANPTILSGDLGSVGNSYHVVTVELIGQARLDGVIIQDGEATSGSYSSDGAGIYNQIGTVVIENAVIRNNVASDDGGGIRNDGELIILNSTVANNQANGSASTTGGGGLLNTVGATVTIIGSTFNNNQSLRGGAIRNDGALSLINSTLSGNAGGGLLNTTTNPLSGTAIASQATIVNSTLVQNGGTGIDNFGSVTLANSLIAGNNNGDNDLAAFAFGTFTSNGHNLIGDRGTVNSFTRSDLVGTAGQSIDPLLGALQDNGGFTQTHQLNSESPANNGGGNSLVVKDTLDLDGDGDTTEAIPFDQRGLARVSGDRVDIGAVEAAPESTEPTDASEQPEDLSIAPPLLANNDALVFSGGANTFLKLSLTAFDVSQGIREILAVPVDAQNRLDGFEFGSDEYFQRFLEQAQVVFSIGEFGALSSPELSRTLKLAKDTRLEIVGVREGTLDGLRRDRSRTDLVSLAIDPQLPATGQLTITGKGLTIQAEATDTSPPIGSDVQGGYESELIDLRNISGSIAATFEVYREADLDNEVGFFKVEDVTGSVLDSEGNLLGVGAEGYVRAAMQRRISASLSSQNNGSQRYRTEIEGGQLLSSFIVSGGRAEDVMNGGGQAVFFTHLGANSDRSDHVRLLGDNVFGFEDTRGGGDQDFDDLIVKASFA